MKKQIPKENTVTIMNKKFPALFIITTVCLLFLGSYCSTDKNNYNSNASDSIGWSQVPWILKNIVPPSFPNHDFNIVDYGAKPDGKTLSTEAFNKAIATCNKTGGGRVVVPKGIFLTGTIHLDDNVNLHISEGAIVKFSINPKDYLPLVHTRYEGIECMNYSPLIYAYGKKNIALTGKGLLDGQADNEHWWPWVGKEEFGWEKGIPSMKDDGNREALSKMNDEQVPLDKRVFGKGHYLRPTFVEFYNCKNILIKDVSLKDSPFWFLHPTMSSNITIDRIKTNSVGPNTDGCDPESCTNVLIENCIFNDGDDCIAIKSGRNNDGRRINQPSTNFVIRNCKMKDGHGGVVVGSEITGGCWNIFAEDCEMNSPNLDRALRIKTNSKRGGVVKNIYMRNVKVGQVNEAIVKINLHYDPKEAEGYNYKPVVDNINVENVQSIKSKYALYLDGLANSEIKNVFIKDCRFNGVVNGNNIKYAKKIEFKNVYINGKLQ
jgi:polygalacturonase